MTSPDDPLEPLMAAMAAGDLPAVWSFHETFEAKLAAVVLANVRSMHRPDIVRDSGRIDSLTADAAMVIFDRAAGWARWRQALELGRSRDPLDDRRRDRSPPGRARQRRQPRW